MALLPLTLKSTDTGSKLVRNQLIEKTFLTSQLLCSPTNNLILPVDNLQKNEAENVTSGTIRLRNANLEKIEPLHIQKKTFLTGLLLCIPTNNLSLPVDNLPQNEAENVTSGTIRLRNEPHYSLNQVKSVQLGMSYVLWQITYVLMWSLDNGGLKLVRNYLVQFKKTFVAVPFLGTVCVLFF